MDGRIKEHDKKTKMRKEFFAGFTAGLICFGSIAAVLLLIFTL
jgi:hypothetical protein